MNYRAWQMTGLDAAGEKALTGAGYGALLARVLAARGYTTPEKARALLADQAPLSDPFLIKDMDKAVARLRRALENDEPIVIFGDYDVDGVSATAILYEYLTNLGAQVRCRLPLRTEGGYGITKDVLKKLADKGFTLVVTVDNGVSAVEEAAYAKELGIDLLVTDHHLPPDPLPEAVAVVDPNRTDDTSPFKNLCGAGVAFKLCAAMEGCAPEEMLDVCGDLAAIGTVADVMPLVGENRTIVQSGLTYLQDTMRPGVAALLESAGLAGKAITAENISYGLAPRLNAAGRMDSAAIALKLLLCEEEDQATGIAARLNEVNTERQSVEQAILAAAVAELEADPRRANDRVIVAAGDNWHPGVLGIVAGRLCEKYGRPAIVISMTDGEGRGSGRAPSGFNLHGALTACAGELIRYGGHAAAAGLQIREEKLQAFRAAVNAWAVREYPVPKPAQIRIDAEAAIAELTVDAVSELNKLAPFGSGNRQPVFLLRGAAVDGIWPLGAKGQHCRLRLRQGQASCFVSMFGTSTDQLPYHTGSLVDAAVELSIFEGRSGPMISARLNALRPAGLGNEPSRQAALFGAFCGGAALSPDDRTALTPARTDTVALYRMVQGGGVFADDLQPVFAAVGADNTGKALTSLTALTELGLVELQGGRYRAAAVSGKRDLMSAPVLKRLSGEAAAN